MDSIEDSTLRDYTRFLIGDDDGDPVCRTQVNGVRKKVVSLNLGSALILASLMVLIIRKKQRRK